IQASQTYIGKLKKNKKKEEFSLGPFLQDPVENPIHLERPVEVMLQTSVLILGSTWDSGLSNLCL
ncbi:hypothetical protein ACQP3D_28810, partial [Escherichia coli]